MIRIKINKRRVLVKASGNEWPVIREVAFAAAACIKEISGNKSDFNRIKESVIDELSKFTLNEDGREFDFSAFENIEEIKPE